jgi:hypothetical protein
MHASAGARRLLSEEPVSQTGLDWASWGRNKKRHERGKRMLMDGLTAGDGPCGNVNRTRARAGVLESWCIVRAVAGAAWHYVAWRCNATQHDAMRMGVQVLLALLMALLLVLVL